MAHSFIKRVVCLLRRRIMFLSVKQLLFVQLTLIRKNTWLVLSVFDKTTSLIS